jgi:hypothetical protein
MLACKIVVLLPLILTVLAFPSGAKRIDKVRVSE